MDFDLNSINLAVSWALFGLIWMVQLVQYPSFRFIAEDQFPAFHQHHTRAISIVVMPLMLIEAGLGTCLVWASAGAWNTVVPLILVALIWASTFFIQVPDHNALAVRKDDSVIAHLVYTNWIRTALWSAKALWVYSLMG